MRIIGGKFKGRKFNPPAGKWPTRPTTDFAKEGLFNILSNTFDFSAIKVLDLFGGTGSIDYELVSRGCENVTYVDKHFPCIAFVKKTKALLEIEDEIKIIKADAFKYIAKTTDQFDLIIADPPYAHPGLKTIPDVVFENNLLTEEGWLILEHDNKSNFENHALFFRKQKYGNNIFSFFSASE
jgi:16S rRNA (guanine(966)-N(2))-methyltransferase RsmD